MATSQAVVLRSRVGTKILRAGFVVVVFLISLSFGRYALATTFWSYDDEGYMLASLDRYFRIGHLYTDTYSQYGPFYFFVQKAFFRTLSLPVDHDAGRLVTLIYWLGSAILAGYFIYKVSKSAVLASAAGFATMFLARVLANEPGHPAQVIQLAFMLACCASLLGGVVGWILLGACGAALVFTKINVGIFFLAAVAFTLVCRFPPGRIRNIGMCCLIVYAVAVPPVLMHRDVPGWAWKYCLIAILIGSFTFLAGFITTPSSPHPMRSAVGATLGALSATALIVLGVLWQGMSLATLMDGVVWAPLRHPGVWQKPLNVSIPTVVLVILACGLIAWLYSIRDRWPAYPQFFGILRCVTGLSIITLIIGNFAAWHLFLAVLLPLGLIPKREGVWQPSDFFPRLFVAGLAATQVLQPYPVAGTHLYISEAPLLLWAFICLHDGLDELSESAGRRDWLRGTGLEQAVAGVLLVVLLCNTMLDKHAWRPRYLFPASSLRGASSLHLPLPVEETYEFLAKNIEANCDEVFALPGMGSLNFWSGVPTPNGVYLGPWMKAVTLDEQQKILENLQKDLQACVVYNGELVPFWGPTDKDLDALPLAQYILHDMRTTSQLGHFEIRVNPQRSRPWISIHPAPTANGELQLPAK